MWRSAARTDTGERRRQYATNHQKLIIHFQLTVHSELRGLSEPPAIAT
jgi:hypothetical protein